jgi:hypothetical protein
MSSLSRDVEICANNPQIYWLKKIKIWNEMFQMYGNNAYPEMKTYHPTQEISIL